MPPYKTYHDNKNIYSVDMMLAYINTHEHPITKIKIEELEPQMEENVWGDWSPVTVLEKRATKKYANDVKRIYEANLDYPIIVTAKHTIVDGYHRVAKAMLHKNKEVRAYVFDSVLMKKCIVDKNMDFIKVHQQTSISDIIELWNKQFCN